MKTIIFIIALCVSLVACTKHQAIPIGQGTYIMEGTGRFPMTAIYPAAIEFCKEQSLELKGVEETCGPRNCILKFRCLPAGDPGLKIE
jgi:hypothetical protein